MPTLHVCPLSRLSQTVNATGADHLVTLVSSGMPVERPQSISVERHLILNFSDIVAPLVDHVLPDETHIRALLDFVRGWDRGRPLVIHCYAGISRSTAAGYIATCALRPDKDEAVVARALRAACVMATPNRLLIEIADRLLERDGRMVSAIAAIGRGADAFEGEPFDIHLD